MNGKKLPAAVLVAGFLFILVGGFGFFRNLHGFREHEFVWIELTEIVAVVAGVFMLRRQNWARWLALAWMAFHVVLTFFLHQSLIAHLVIFALIAWLLFSSESREYFQAG